METQTIIQKGVLKSMVFDYKNGMPSTQIGQKYGVNLNRVKTVLSQEGLSRRDLGSLSYNKRLKAMLTAERAGKSRGEIAEAFGLSRRRVNEIFKEHHDDVELTLDVRQPTVDVKAPVVKPDNPKPTKAAKAVKPAKSVVSKPNAKQICQRWGFTPVEYELHVGLHGNSTKRGAPMHCYVAQRTKYNAKGFEWKFNFKDWWRMWVESGRWEQRGRARFVMGRKDKSCRVMSPQTCHVFYLPDVLNYQRFLEEIANMK